MAGESYQLRDEDLSNLEAAGKAVNQNLKSIAGRLDKIEDARTGFVDVDFRTAATVASTFPLKVTPPTGIVPKSVKLGCVQATEAPRVQIASALFLHWAPETDGSITILNIVGLSANTRYRIALEVSGRG